MNRRSKDRPRLSGGLRRSRRALFRGLPPLILAPSLVTFGACGRQRGSPGILEKTWGRRGLGPGRLQKPRAMAIDAEDQLYIVDMTARVQVFDTDGNYLRGWRTPAWQNGRPSGLSIGREGLVWVADTHYFRVLCYTPSGQLLAGRTVGGTHGHRPGQFGFVTDAVEDSRGNLFISEYGEYDRVQKFSPRGALLSEWGSHGSRRGQFIRPQNMAIDQDDRIWVADACNHRVQVFDDRGTLVRCWGRQGHGPGDLYYPYDLALDGRGHVAICEFGNHRVQKLTLDGRSIACWGCSGRGPGQLNHPWALVYDRRHRIHVLDTNDHRVHRIRL